MAYILAKTVAGQTIEIEKYYAYGYTGAVKTRCRAKKTTPTREEQKKVNDKQAVKKLRRLMNENFTQKSWYITLDYIKEPDRDYVTPEQMKEDLRELMRKLRSLCKKQRVELKYVTVMAIGKKSARHFHMVISEIEGWMYERVRDAVQKIWDSIYLKAHSRKSYIHIKNLQGKNYGQLAAYFVKQSKMTIEAYGKKIGKRWNASRNLRKPVTKKYVMANRSAFKQEAKPFKGYYIDPDYTEQGLNNPEFGNYEFFRYLMVKLD